MATEKIDPHKHEHYWTSWKDKGMPLEGLSEANKQILIKYLLDMEKGKNVNIVSKKGPRGPGRLRNLKSKLYGIFLLLEKGKGVHDISKVTEDDLLEFFEEMRKGKIKSPWTEQYFSGAGTYVKVMKSFWHWYILVSHREGKEIPTVVAGLDAKDEKPKFNYFTIEQLKQLCNNAKFYYKVLMMFLYDSGIRAPTEMMNIRLSDLEWKEKDNCYSLNIRDEISKTFGRRIKLLLCSEIIRDYIQQNKFKKDDVLFPVEHKNVNKYFRELGYKILKIGSVKKDKNNFWVNEGLTMYDFRHSSACYWLVRYKSESSLKYRFGWKKSDMIHYYTELLGMKDTIQEEDLYVDITKTELENELQRLKREIEVRDERYKGEVGELREALKKREKYDTVLEQIFSNDKVRKMVLSGEVRL